MQQLTCENNDLRARLQRIHAESSPSEGATSNGNHPVVIRRLVSEVLCYFAFIALYLPKDKHVHQILMLSSIVL